MDALVKEVGMRLDIEQVIDGARLGPLHWRVLILCALVLFWLAIIPALICAGSVGLLRTAVSRSQVMAPAA
jgi:hypothetical protein